MFTVNGLIQIETLRTVLWSCCDRILKLYPHPKFQTYVFYLLSHRTEQYYWPCKC